MVSASIFVFMRITLPAESPKKVIKIEMLSISFQSLSDSEVKVLIALVNHKLFCGTHLKVTFR